MYLIDLCIYLFILYVFIYFLFVSGRKPKVWVEQQCV